MAYARYGKIYFALGEASPCTSKATLGWLNQRIINPKERTFQGQYLPLSVCIDPILPPVLRISTLLLFNSSV